MNEYNYNNYDNYSDLKSEETTSYQFHSLADIVDTDSVLRKSFGFMVIALMITAFGAFITPVNVAIAMLQSNSFFILILAELGLVFVSNYAIRNNKVVLAGVLYAVYSFITGMTFSVLALIYTGSSITSVFLITAVTFGIMCLYGFTTKTDLSAIGNICLMAIIGIVITSLVNMFLLQSEGVSLALSYVGVLIFVGLTAYDVQKIKSMADTVGEENENALALYGAFQLYLDFINLFLRLLRILGKKRR